MTRKDTILIAVLVNVALLIALFVTAIKRDDKKLSPTFSHDIAEVQSIALPESQKMDEIKMTKGDEIDQVLKEFSEKSQVKEGKTTKAIDFAKELEAITKAANSKEIAAPKSGAGGKAVTVRKGDILEKIARAHQVSVDEIITYNHLASTTLQIGQVLKIPGKNSASSTASLETTKYYTVKQGDNPWTIAVKNKIKVDELLKLNDLNEEKARCLRPGDKLRIQ
ncbi:MAG: D-gamma-glutamyl-meso-diaminopimelic acid endopeptidase CwlS [Chlamydiae bacterium]|nr:D-gamma-glutamyl-meso-diaminopimelic acid endopeptidase CwlS [Chlamydiota bacterium]